MLLLNYSDDIAADPFACTFETIFQLYRVVYLVALKVVPPPQRPTAAILYSNPLGCPCTLSGDLHGLSVLHGKVQNEEAWVLIVIKRTGHEVRPDLDQN